MTFEVEMNMFQNGVIREVDVPDADLNGKQEHDLGKIFYYGQNDFQPLPDKVSVSAGDVIRYQDKRYLILFLGFEDIGNEQLPISPTELIKRIMNENNNKH